MHEMITFPEHEYESVRNYLKKLGYCYTTRVYKEVGKYKVGEIYTAPWGDLLKIEDVKTYRKVSERPFYDEMSEQEKEEIRKYSEDMGLPYEFIKFSEHKESVDKLEYRKANENDIELLMSVRQEMLRKVNGLNENYDFSNVLKDCSKRYFLEGDQTTVIATDGGKCVACASISYIEVMPTYSHPTGKRAHIMNVYTHDNYRRRGIARRLVNILIEEAKERGVTEIGLDATQMGKPLYKSLGFNESTEYMTLKLS